MGQTELGAHLAKLTWERDELRRYYMEAMERARKLELGLLSKTRERMPAEGEQISMKLLGALIAGTAPTTEDTASRSSEGASDGAASRPGSDGSEASGESGAAGGPKPPEPRPWRGKRRRPRGVGRQRPAASLPRVRIETLPPEVLRGGLDRFDRIGEEKSELTERRRPGTVIVELVRPKFIEKPAAGDSTTEDGPTTTEAAEAEASDGGDHDKGAPGLVSAESVEAESVGAAIADDTEATSGIDVDVQSVARSEEGRDTCALERGEVGGAEREAEVAVPVRASAVVPPSDRHTQRPENTIRTDPRAVKRSSDKQSARQAKKARKLAKRREKENAQLRATSARAPRRGPTIEQQLAGEVEPTRVFIADPFELPIPRSKVGPGLLSETVVRRWEEHMPLHRLERSYKRSGLQVARSTICGWHQQLAEQLRPLIKAMHEDTLRQPVICTDATGVLVQAPKRCKIGHFWVLIAPKLHAMFFYSAHHDSEAVDRFLKGFQGTLVADAHSVYDYLYRDHGVIEAGCWAHLRRYWHKALSTEPERAGHALGSIAALFKLEEDMAGLPPEQRLAQRRELSARLVDGFFAWCRQEAPNVLDGTPIHDAIRYALNQERALRRFLEDGRVPIHNNWSELQLRREKLGRKNWLFLGTDDAAQSGDVNACFVSLLASCQLHDLDPSSYMLDLLCLFPSWPVNRILELAPAYWTQTLKRPEVQKRLDEHPLRRIALDLEPLPQQLPSAS
jgi:transposase